MGVNCSKCRTVSADSEVVFKDDDNVMLANSRELDENCTYNAKAVEYQDNSINAFEIIETIKEEDLSNKIREGNLMNFGENSVNSSNGPIIETNKEPKNFVSKSNRNNDTNVMRNEFNQEIGCFKKFPTQKSLNEDSNKPDKLDCIITIQYFVRKYLKSKKLDITPKVDNSRCGNQIIDALDNNPIDSINHDNNEIFEIENLNENEKMDEIDIPKIDNCEVDSNTENITERKIKKNLEDLESFENDNKNSKEEKPSSTESQNEKIESIIEQIPDNLEENILNKSQSNIQISIKDFETPIKPLEDNNVLSPTTAANLEMQRNGEINYNLNSFRVRQTKINIINDYLKEKNQMLGITNAVEINIEKTEPLKNETIKSEQQTDYNPTRNSNLDNIFTQNEENEKLTQSFQSFNLRNSYESNNLKFDKNDISINVPEILENGHDDYKSNISEISSNMNPTKIKRVVKTIVKKIVRVSVNNKNKEENLKEQIKKSLSMLQLVSKKGIKIKKMYIENAFKIWKEESYGNMILLKQIKLEKHSRIRESLLRKILKKNQKNDLIYYFYDWNRKILKIKNSFKIGATILRKFSLFKEKVNLEKYFRKFTRVSQKLKEKNTLNKLKELLIRKLIFEMNQKNIIKLIEGKFNNWRKNVYQEDITLTKQEYLSIHFYLNRQKTELQTLKKFLTSWKLISGMKINPVIPKINISERINLKDSLEIASEREKWRNKIRMFANKNKIN